MQVFAETERLTLREMIASDDAGMYELDSDPEVHRFLGNKPVTSIDESRKIIELVRQQYIDFGIGRWAVVEKQTGKFIGWAGLKLVRTETNKHINYYDLGYRLIRSCWGKGFATEAAKASVQYAFDTLKLEELFATADMNNTGSRNVLQKAGLTLIESFIDDGHEAGWYRITKSDYRNLK